MQICASLRFGDLVVDCGAVNNPFLGMRGNDLGGIGSDAVFNK